MNSPTTDNHRAIDELVFAAHALARIAALRTRNETPAAQWRTLAILRQQRTRETANDGVRIGELAHLSRVTQPGMTRLIAQMDSAGLVERGPDPEDSRATVVRITPEGEAALESWRLQMREALIPLFSDIDDEDWATITRAADIIRTRTENAE